MRMPKIKYNVGRYASALAIAAAVAAISSPSLAQSVYLRCAQGASHDDVNIDLSNHTANGRPATITATTIDWQFIPQASDEGTTGVIYYHVDRVSGTMTTYATYHLRNGRNMSSGQTVYYCTPGEPPATKF